MTSTERERERERKRENEEVHKQKLKKCSQQGNKLRIQKETKGTLAGREKIATFREKEKVTLDIYDNCDKRYALAH